MRGSYISLYVRRCPAVYKEIMYEQIWDDDIIEKAIAWGERQAGNAPDCQGILPGYPNYPYILAKELERARSLRLDATVQKEGDEARLH